MTGEFMNSRASATNVMRSLFAASTVLALAGAGSARAQANSQAFVMTQITGLYNDPLRANPAFYTSVNNYQGQTVSNNDFLSTVKPEVLTGVRSSRTLGNINATSYADLNTGKVGASAYAKGSGVPGNSVPYNGNVASISGFQDILHFVSVGADASTITALAFSIYLHGTLEGSSQYGFRGGFIGTSAIVAGNSSRLTYSQVVGDTSISQFDSETILIRGTATFAGENWTNYFFSEISVSADGLSGDTYGRADFLQTASVVFDLPQNVTFTSDSGVFLSEVSAVPESATWGMMLAGFGMMGAAMRTRRRSTKVSFARPNSTP